MLHTHAMADSIRHYFDKLNFSDSFNRILGPSFVDRKNQLWIGLSEHNLVRYNGTDKLDEYPFWIGYKHIEVDHWNRIWAEHAFDNTESLPTYFNLNTGTAHSVRFVNESGRFLDAHDRFALNNTETALWLLDDTGDLYKAEIPKNIIKPIVFHKQIHIRLENNDFKTAENELTIDASDNVWLGLHHQIIKYQPKTKQLIDYSSYVRISEPLGLGVIVSKSQQGNTWVALKYLNQLLHIDQQGHVKVITVSSRIYDIQADNPRHIDWLTTVDDLYYSTGQDDKFRQYTREFFQDAGISVISMRDMNLDMQGNLWITTNLGLNVMRDVNINTKRITPNLYRGSHKPDPQLRYLRVITSESPTVLWWVNRKRELVRYDQTKDIEAVYPIRVGHYTAKDSPDSLAISGHYVYLSTVANNLFRFNMHNHKFLPPIRINNETFSNSNGSRNYFVFPQPDKTGKLWMAEAKSITSGKEAIKRFTYWDTLSNMLRNFDCAFTKDINSISGIEAYSEYKQTMWAVPLDIVGNRILKMDMLHEHCELLYFTGTNEHIYNIFQYDDSSIWVVQGSKLLQLSSTNLHTVLSEYQIPIAVLKTVTEGDTKEILFYGEGILWRFNINERHWELLSATEVGGNNRSLPKVVMGVEKRFFYITTTDGISVIDTYKPIRYTSPSVKFVSAEITEVRHPLFEQNRELTLHFGDTLKLNYRSVPEMPSKLSHYRYRFSTDQSWTMTKENAPLLFGQLQPGLWQLDMQVTYDYIHYSPSCRLTVRVLPPWNRSNWAYTLYVIIGLLLLYLLVDWFRSKERLRSAKLTSSVFDHTSEGLCVLSDNFCIIKINGAMQTLVGWEVGDNITSLLSNVVVEGAHDKLLSLFALHSFSAAEPWMGEVIFTKQNTPSFYAELTIDRLGNKSHGQYVMVAKNISERKAYEENLIYLARHDYLTDLPNRLYFDEFVNKLLMTPKNTANQDCYALILLDLDDFKTINDSFGHKAGDLLLVSVARDLENMLKHPPYIGINTVARHSGDEFLMLVNVLKSFDKSLESWLSLLLQTISSIRRLHYAEVEVTASIGITFMPDNGIDSSMLLQQADMALYMAKKTGKGRYFYYNHSLDNELKHQIEIENALTGKISHNGLRLRYQPKVSLKNGQIVGFEALARWELESGELLSPNQFLHLIRPGKIEKNFGLAVVTRAAQDCLSLLEINSSLKMSINLSPRHLDDPDYIEQLCAAIEHQQAPTQLFMFEILEDAGMDNLAVLKNFNIIKKRNIGLSIDDFGTGYSNLFHLNKISANELKIDRSLTNCIPGDPSSEKLLENILELAEMFNLNVVCEGVETLAQLKYLSTTACQYYQGYYFSPPVPLAQARKLLESNLVDNVS